MNLAGTLIIYCISRKKIGDKQVTVAITPNGYADGILNHDGKDYFVMPEEKLMTMNEFLDNLDSPK